METKDTLSLCSNLEEQQMQQIQDKAKKELHCTMFLNVDQLEKQLDKDEFEEIRSMVAFKYFLEYTQLEVQQFCDTLIQQIEFVKESIDKRALHKKECDSRVNERHMQTKEGKVDTSKALDASLVDTESRGTESEKQNTSNSLGNDTDADDADIKPVYDEEPMAEVQMTTECNVFDIGQQHTKQPEFNNEGGVDQDAEQCHNICPLPAQLTNNQIAELSHQSSTVKSGQQSQFLNEKSNEAKVKNDIDVIETINIELKHKVAKLLKENETLKKHYKELYDSIKTTRANTIEHTTSLIAQNAEFKAQIQEKGFAITALKNKLRKLTGNSVNTKFAKPSILAKPILHTLKNQSVVRQPNAFKTERPKFSKPWFASKVDVKKLPKLVTTHYLPRERESAFVKPHHVIAPSSYKNSSKSVSTSTLKETYGSNDMIHNYYLDYATKKTQESGRNSRPSVMPSAKSQSTANGSKPKPKINNQNSRNWPASKSSCVTTKTVLIAEHSRNSRSFSDFKHFVCSTCQKCIFNANHDSCVTKFLNEVNLRAKMGKILKTVGLRWVPTGMIFTSSTTMVNSEPLHGSNTDITNLHECIQAFDLSAVTNGNPSRVNIKQLYGSLTPAESDSIPYAHAQTIKTYYWHLDSRIKKAQVHTKKNTSANSDIQDLPLRYQVYQGDYC
ncbi:hypothetical protein Tco_0018899 [Tanacetum coccineum]